MLVTKGHTVARAMQISVALCCLPGPWRQLSHELMLRAVSGSMALLQPGSVLMSVSCLTTEGDIQMPEVWITTRDKLMAKGHAATGAILISVVHAAN